MAAEKLGVTDSPASGNEVPPLGVRPQQEYPNTPDADAAWVGAQAAAAASMGDTSGPSYAGLSDHPPVGDSPKMGYDAYKHQGRE